VIGQRERKGKEVEGHVRGQSWGWGVGVGIGVVGVLVCVLKRFELVLFYSKCWILLLTKTTLI
jgi:hypothetical protein